MFKDVIGIVAEDNEQIIEQNKRPPLMKTAEKTELVPL
jgi:hypothetical protein